MVNAFSSENHKKQWKEYVQKQEKNKKRSVDIYSKLTIKKPSNKVSLLILDVKLLEEG